MKIGILTFHYAHNYGAMLQAYALTTKLNNLGYNTEIIDYRLPKIYNNHDKLSLIKLYQTYHENNNFFLSILKTLKNYYRHKKKDEKWHNFELFLKNKLKKSARITNPDLSGLDYDVIICGSDQIWNSELTGKLEPIYFAYSAKNSVKKISYAASNGASDIKESEINTFKKYINNIDDISVREYSFKKNISIHTNKKIDTVLDPIFLLDEKEWEAISATNFTIKNKYLLTYSFGENDLFFDLVEGIARITKLKTVRFCFKKNKRVNKDTLQITDGGPCDFLSYFKNSSLIITNSFHGVAFSILFKKQFYCVLPKKNKQRVVDIIELFGLNDRIISSIDDSKNINQINYKNIDVKIQLLKNESISFLTKSLQHNA